MPEHMINGVARVDRENAGPAGPDFDAIDVILRRGTM